jgi:general secretion pathway protein B
VSYILDALRRADRERSRGQLPDLLGVGAQSATGAARAGPGRRALPWLLLGLAAGLLVALIVRWAWPAAPQRLPQAAPMALPPMPAAPDPATPPAVLPQAPPTTTIAPIQAGSPPRQAPQPPFMPAPPSPPPAPDTPTVPAAPATADAQPAQPAAGASAARGATEGPPIVAFAALPEDLRRALPQPRFSGAIHSPVAANRMVIVDGQIAREGDTVAPGLVLEQIRPRSVVLRHPLARYELAL